MSGADARDAAVWTNHAAEQLSQNTEVHVISEGCLHRRWLISHMKPGSKVLDFGSGTCLWINLFDGYDYHAVDQNESMIAGAKQRFPERADKFQITQWNKLPFEDHSFNMVWTSAVLQHNRHADKESVLREFARVIKPGGFYMCTENTFRPDNYKTTFPHIPEWRDQLTDGYSLTSGGWKRLIETFGFELLEYQDPSEYLYRRSQ